MKALFAKKGWMVLLIIAGTLLLFLVTTRSRPVDFSTEIKPIFNRKCITCHGGVRRKAGFSLLFREEALSKCESGKFAIIPGDPEHSELLKRVRSKDPEERMPYRHEPLTEKEISTLKRWIKEGAVWGDHWAYQPVARPQVPGAKGLFSGFFSSENTALPEGNEVDQFVGDKLKKQSLTPSPEAEKPVLLRRLSLDITGIPAPADWAAAYLQAADSKAYERLADSLLSSSHYGERWAAVWMDLARYADTKGYERDDGRSIWRYRDWLIRSFNADKPYDRFITEQIAGDLLPDPDDNLYIATAFHRNTMTNDEGGTDNEEFRTAAVLDRVNTTWEALMGTTFACAQCHGHPYDPFTHDEYYKFMAFFNDTRDEDSYADYPLLRSFSDSAKQELDELIAWVKQNAGESEASGIKTFLRTWQPAINSLTADQFVNSELADTKWLVFRNHAHARLKHVDLEKRGHLIYRYNCFTKNGVWKLHLDKPDGEVIATVQAKPTKDWEIAELDFPVQKGIHDLWFSYENNSLKKPDQSGMQFDWFHFCAQFPGKQNPGYAGHREKFWKLLAIETPTTPVMMDNPADMHRISNVFERGNWLAKGKEVNPEVPHSLNPFPTGAPHNRLGLAQWLTSKQNPLLARTLVNRVWEQLFGTGLVETLEDLGTQGASPSNQELLDYLSWKFMNDYQWSIKKLIKEIVMSGTYRQDSKLTKEALEKDPFNKWYARGARVRLSAEQVRDQALSISGLLSNKICGPSVMPYQPKGIWLSPWNGQDWLVSQGEDKYRRAIYTYWKRTAPYPAMISFDGAPREFCVSRRIRTNTPLQALVTLNDETFLEAARNFAYRMQKEGGPDIDSQIGWGYKLALYQSISAARKQALLKLYKEAYDRFKNDKEKACEMNGLMDKHNNPETAALIVVANAMLNLDELITKN